MSPRKEVALLAKEPAVEAHHARVPPCLSGECFAGDGRRQRGGGGRGRVLGAAAYRARDGYGSRRLREGGDDLGVDALLGLAEPRRAHDSARKAAA